MAKHYSLWTKNLKNSIFETSYRILDEANYSKKSLILFFVLFKMVLFSSKLILLCKRVSFFILGWIISYSLNSFYSKHNLIYWIITSCSVLGMIKNIKVFSSIILPFKRLSFINGRFLYFMIRFPLEILNKIFYTLRIFLVGTKPMID